LGTFFDVSGPFKAGNGTSQVLRSSLRLERKEWSEILPKGGRGMRFIDSHLHLSEYGNRTSWAAFARFSETMLVSSGIDSKSSLATLQLAEGSGGRPVVKAFVGCHPSEAEKGADLNWFEAALERATGAGELGLDPGYAGFGQKGDQMTSFTRQLKVVERSGKPLQVHSRGAERQCLDTLSSYRLGRVLKHWFEGEPQLEAVLDRGYFVSFGPALVHSKRLQRMASRYDPAHVLVESDGPVSFKALGGAEGSALIPTVIFKLAELWHEPFSETQEKILRNSLHYLGDSEKT